MYDRNIGGKTLTFRFLPDVFKENLLVEDSETGSVWSQLAQEAVKGPMKGTQLKALPTVQTTWEHWRQLYPHTLVLSPRLGLSKKSYQYIPRWTGYSNVIRGMRPRELVLALTLGNVEKAYPFLELKKAGGKIEDDLDGKKVQIIYDKKAESAIARDEDGELLPAFTAYWGSWVQFHRQTEVYAAKKRSVQGIFEKISNEGKTFRLIDEKSGERWNFAVGQKTNLKADKKVLGKKQLSWTDLTTNLRVEVKFIQGVREALEIKVVGKRP